MKVACLVNNYQYGESRFEKMRQQYAYQDEQIDDKHHVVFLDIEEDGFNFLKQLLNSDLHNNVNKKSGFSEKGWIEMYKKRLHPKVTEDIDFEEVDDTEEPPEWIFDFVSQAHIGEEPFYIIYDWLGLKHHLGTDDRTTEDLLNLYFGDDNWGYEDQWYMCDNCGTAIDSSYGDYAWLDSGCYCKDCIQNVRWIAEDWLSYCWNENTPNYYVSNELLTSLGWHRVCEAEWLNNDNSTYRILDRLAAARGGRFILNDAGYLGWELWTDNPDVDEDNLWDNSGEDR